MKLDRFRLALAEYAEYVRRAAERLAAGDPDLRDDLEQEGLVVVWQLTRWRAGVHSSSVIRRSVWTRMAAFMEWMYGNAGLLGRTRTRTHAMEVCWEKARG